MALPPAQTDDAFIREVDEEYRRDQLNRAWTQYGRWLLIGVGLLLILLAGVLWWREEKVRQQGVVGETYVQALEKVSAANVAGAEPLLVKAAKDGGEGYRTLATLTRAAAAARVRQTDQAAKLYAEVAGDSGAAKPFRDLASVQEIALRIDTMPVDKAIERLKPLALPGAPFFGTAGEMLALAYMRAGKPELAGPLLAQIARDNDAPPSIRARTAQLASMLGVNVLPTGAGSMAK